MPWRNVIDAEELLDDPSVTGERVADWLRDAGVSDVSVQTVTGEKGTTDFLRAVIPGTNGRSAGGDAPTLGLIGRLGGIGARPEKIGIVSDGDGALTAIAAAAKLGIMRRRGDGLPGDVIVTTHICPNAPTRPHDPVPFMDSPVDINTMNNHEIDPAMDAVLSVDTTKGNRICNHQGFAITPTVKQGWILRVREDVLDVAAITTGAAPAVLAITNQDITPYGNGVFHINSLLQPAVATTAPVIGVAITTETAVPGSATGATSLTSVESATRFCIEVAKEFGAQRLHFYDTEEYQLLQDTYGSLDHLRGASRD
ncbi:DUF1177 domain-containing protein [Actinoalloteichus hymeniacidonis]|uniref:DUF1177 family protein n=1 Tax=Actinoalloteichus hymeniacidonis TaxID=340345 RepID=A0AAC9HRC8_9PSEU|nr:DUF1177 domain-containing protein [Actinoalloteichus hymeniacidonis]AOS63938.1 putative DUF1177 family protein [Actinoalloteichus hymeniacidonis]MBB5908005.1 hypothetical protein [Actinoalloteichus hymeniacidonis]